MAEKNQNKMKNFEQKFSKIIKIAKNATYSFLNVLKNFEKQSQKNIFFKEKWGSLKRYVQQPKWHKTEKLVVKFISGGNVRVPSSYN